MSELKSYEIVKIKFAINFQELAMEDFHAMPIHAAYLTLHERCAISSRGTGVVRNWRISRFFFRHLSDYNKMSGVRRGIW